MSSGTERLTELISAYIDGEVNEQERVECERLLTEDSRASEIYEQLNSTRAMFNSLSAVQAPARLRNSILNSATKKQGFFERLRESFSPRPIRGQVLTYVGGALILVVVFGSLFLFNQPGLFVPSTEVSDTLAEADASDAEEKQVTPAEDEFAAFEAGETDMRDRAAEFDEGAGFSEPASAAAPAMSRERPRINSNLTPASGPLMYRAELLETYNDDGSYPVDAVSRPDQYMVSGGQMISPDPQAPEGSNNNPLVEAVDLGTVGIPYMEFPSFGPDSGNGSFIIDGSIHVGADGRVISFQLFGPASAAGIIDRYAAHLSSSRLLPALHDGRKVSVLYNFVSTIYRVNDGTTD